MNPATLADAAETWARARGLTPPRRGTPAWQGMFSAWQRTGMTPNPLTLDEASRLLSFEQNARRSAGSLTSYRVEHGIPLPSPAATFAFGEAYGLARAVAETARSPKARAQGRSREARARMGLIATTERPPRTPNRSDFTAGEFTTREAELGSLVSARSEPVLRLLSAGFGGGRGFTRDELAAEAASVLRGAQGQHLRPGSVAVRVGHALSELEKKGYVERIGKALTAQGRPGPMAFTLTKTGEERAVAGQAVDDFAFGENVVAEQVARLESLPPPALGPLSGPLYRPSLAVLETPGHKLPPLQNKRIKAAGYRTCNPTFSPGGDSFTGYFPGLPREVVVRDIKAQLSPLSTQGRYHIGSPSNDPRSFLGQWSNKEEALEFLRRLGYRQRGDAFELQGHNLRGSAPNAPASLATCRVCGNLEPRSNLVAGACPYCRAIYGTQMPAALYTSNAPRSKKCRLGAHDFEPATGLCRRVGCQAFHHAGQGTMFGRDLDPVAVAEARARELLTGQRDMFGRPANPTGYPLSGLGVARDGTEFVPFRPRVGSKRPRMRFDTDDEAVLLQREAEEARAFAPNPLTVAESKRFLEEARTLRHLAGQRLVRSRLTHSPTQAVAAAHDFGQAEGLASAVRHGGPRNRSMEGPAQWGINKASRGDYQVINTAHDFERSGVWPALQGPGLVGPWSPRLPGETNPIRDVRDAPASPLVWATVTGKHDRALALRFGVDHGSGRFAFSRSHWFALMAEKNKRTPNPLSVLVLGNVPPPGSCPRTPRASNGPVRERGDLPPPGTPGVELVRAHVQMFHGAPGRVWRTIDIDDGKPGIRHEVRSALGLTEATVYSAPWRASNKHAAGVYEHVHETRKPLEVYDPVTNTTQKVLEPGSGPSDWWRDNRDTLRALKGASR